MKLANVIKTERKKLGWTQEQLAQEFFVTRQLISKWENGKSYPDLEQVVKISDLFAIPLDQLLRDDQEMVEELNFDSRKKKLFQLMLTLIVTFCLGGAVIIGLLFWHDTQILSAKELKITKIEKTILPQKQVLNQLTKQKVILPQDVEYTIYFECERPFIDLRKISGYAKNVDEHGIDVEVYGNRKLFNGQKKSRIVIRSQREKSLDQPTLNWGKDLIIYRLEKPDKSADPSSRPQTFLYSWEELAKLPDHAKK